MAANFKHKALIISSRKPTLLKKIITMKKLFIFTLIAVLLLTPQFNVEAQEGETTVYNYFLVTKAANVRAKPNMNGKIIGGVHADDLVYVLTRNNDWCSVEFEGYKEAYIYCNLLEEDTSAYADYDYTTNDFPPETSLNSSWSSFSLANQACDKQTQICSGNYQISISGYFTEKERDRQDLNLHVHGSFDLLNPGAKKMSININGSAGSIRDSVQGSAQIIATSTQTFIKFENVLGKKLFGEFPLEQNIWFATEKGLSTLAINELSSISNTAALQDLFPNSQFINSSSHNGITEFHYQVPLNIDALTNFDAFEFEDIPVQELAMLKPQISLDYWVNENNMLTQMSATVYLVDPQVQGNEAKIEFALKLQSINQPIQIEIPSVENTTPISQHALDF